MDHKQQSRVLSKSHRGISSFLSAPGLDQTNKRIEEYLGDHIAREGFTQSQAAKLLGVTQPRISDLTRGRIDLFAIDTLVNMLATAGLRVELNICQAA